MTSSHMGNNGRKGTDMKDAEQSTITGARRRLLGATVVAAAALLLMGSAAWACTQRVGTMTVCRPPSSTYVAAQCAKVTSVTQTGNPTVYSAGSQVSVQAKNFYAKRYQVTFRAPNSNSSCHNPSQPGVNAMADVNTGATTFLGPTFTVTANTPPQTSTGQAKICAEDVPDVITGQIINLTVI
jgi:hypothetical protein